MGDVDYSTSPLLIEALSVWTGWDRESFPRRDESRLITRFGGTVAAQTLPLLKSMEEDYYATDATYTTPTYEDMRLKAIDDFRKKHPGVADEIVEILTWCYMFDYK